MDPKINQTNAGSSLASLSNSINSSGTPPLTAAAEPTRAAPMYVPPSPTPIPTPSFARVIPPQQAAYSNPAMYTAPAQNEPPRKSRTLLLALSVFAVLVLLVTGLLYLYGSSIVSQSPVENSDTSLEQSGTPFTQQNEGGATNGFQVTETGVTEPNFDQQSYYETTPSSKGTVNTTVDAMFTE